MLLMAHYSPAYVQKQLGHSSISITVDIYGHWIPGEGKKDLVKTLRGPKALPGRTLSLVRGEGD
jgi:integrase